MGTPRNRPPFPTATTDANSRSDGDAPAPGRPLWDRLRPVKDSAGVAGLRQHLVRPSSASPLRSSICRIDTHDVSHFRQFGVCHRVATALYGDVQHGGTIEAP